MLKYKQSTTQMFRFKREKTTKERVFMIITRSIH